MMGIFKHLQKVIGMSLFLQSFSPSAIGSPNWTINDPYPIQQARQNAAPSFLATPQDHPSQSGEFEMMRNCRQSLHIKDPDVMTMLAANGIFLLKHGFHWLCPTPDVVHHTLFLPLTAFSIYNFYGKLGKAMDDEMLSKPLSAFAQASTKLVYAAALLYLIVNMDAHGPEVQSLLWAARGTLLLSPLLLLLYERLFPV